MLRLVRFYWDCGRMGDLSGQFVLDDDGWARLQGAYGKRVYFGEVLGKHSEIYGELEEKDITLVTDDQPWLEKAADLGIDLDTGHNPLNYIDEDAD